ncbi:MAG: hypothetical protein WCT14_21785 [Treponemataceae bacterium]
MDVLRERYSGSQKERAEKAELDASEKPAERPAAAPTLSAPAASIAIPIVSVSDEDLVARFTTLIDLRVAEIKKIERHPKADKLYIETLDIAGEERIIVSGLVPYYREEELLGKRIIVAYNLKPAKLRGVDSRGMLLAASSETADGVKMVEVLDARNAPTGSRVYLEGQNPPTQELGEIDIDTFFSIPIRAEKCAIRVGNKNMCVAGSALRSDKVTDGEVG